MSFRLDPFFDRAGLVSHALGNSDKKMLPLGSCRDSLQDEQSKVAALVREMAITTLRVQQDHKISLFRYCSAGILIFYFILLLILKRVFKTTSLPLHCQCCLAKKNILEIQMGKVKKVQF